MLSTASVLQQFIETSKVMSGTCTTLATRDKFDELYTNAAQLYSEENTEFS